MARLGDYRRKRDPSRTPEPFEGGSSEGAPLFVIQRHDARRLHYDLRLERDGALASWAVPKGLPLRAGRAAPRRARRGPPARLRDLRGRDPGRASTARGTVEIWDRGTYELLEEKRDGGLTFRLDGERAQGVWTLVPARLDGKEQNWLLLRKDGAADRETSLRRPARDPCGGAPDGPGVALRAEVGRLPGDRDRRGRRGDAHEP